MNLTPTHILQLGVIPTQKVKDALTLGSIAGTYCCHSHYTYDLSMYLLQTATFRASEWDEKALKGLVNVLHAIFRSDFFSGDTRHGF